MAKRRDRYHTCTYCGWEGNEDGYEFCARCGTASQARIDKQDKQLCCVLVIFGLFCVLFIILQVLGFRFEPTRGF